MGKSRQKADHRADTRGGQWVGIPHAVVDSEAYRSLSLWSRAILIEMVRAMNGFNNGAIAVGYEHLCKRLNNSNKRALAKGIAELMSHGLIDTEADASWKGRRTREYRLTFVNTTPGGKHKPATNDYRDWVKPNPKASDASSPFDALNGNASSPLPKKNGNASSPDKFANLRKTAPFSENAADGNGDDALPLICKPYPTVAIQGGSSQ